MPIQPLTDESHLAEVSERIRLEWYSDVPEADYQRMAFATTRTPWARASVRSFGLVEGGRILASLRVIDHELRVDGRRFRTAGIAAVLVPPDLRGRGHGSALLDDVIARCAEEGYGAALLFSGVDGTLYARLGFEPLECLSYWGEIGDEHDRWGLSVRGLSLIAPRDGDLPRLRGIRKSFTEKSGIALARTESAWDHHWVLDRAATDSPVPPILVAVKGTARPLAYVRARVVEAAVRIQEYGCMPDEEVALRSVLSGLMQAALKAGIGGVRGSLTPDVARLCAFVRGRFEPDRSPMIRSFGDPIAVPPQQEDRRLWDADRF